MNQHVIHRQVFDLKLKSKDEAFALRQRLQEIFLDQVLPVIDRVFSQLAGPDEVLVIDKFELDLGNIRKENIEAEFLAKLEYYLTEKVGQIKAEATVRKIAEERGVFFRRELIGALAQPEIITLAQNRLELIEYFIEKGQLPWWGSNITSDEEFDTIVEEITRQEPEALARVMLRFALRRQPLKRILHQFPEKTLQVILNRLASNARQENLRSWLKAVATNTDNTFTPLRKKQTQLQIMLAGTLHREAIGKPESDQMQDVQSLMTAVAVISDQTVAAIEQKVYAGLIQKSISKPVTEILPEPLVQYFAAEESRIVKTATVKAEDMIPAEELPLAILIHSTSISFAEKIRIIENFLVNWFRARDAEKSSPAAPRKSKKIKPAVSADKSDEVSAISGEDDHTGETTIIRSASAEPGKHGQKKNDKQKYQASAEHPGNNQSKTGTDPEHISKVAIAKNPETVFNPSSEKSSEKASWKQGSESTAEKFKPAYPDTKPGEKKTLTGNQDPEPKKKTDKISSVIQHQQASLKPLAPEEETVPKKKTTQNENTEESESPRVRFEPVLDQIELKEITDTTPEKREQKTEAPVSENEIILPEPEPIAGMTRFGGLVLVANLLPFCFDTLGLLEDDPEVKFGKRFIDDAAAHKAVFLLHFMATGKTKAPEHALMLHKILCGLKTSDTIPRSIKLTQKEKEECLELLTAVAEQWTALRSESGEMIRANFMRRDGILEKKSTDWRLRIERGALDVMLEMFPWSFGTIKLPWMSQLLHVEW